MGETLWALWAISDQTTILRKPTTATQKKTTSTEISLPNFPYHYHPYTYMYIYISIHFTSFLILTWVGNWDMEHQKTLKTWWPPHSHQAWSIFPSDFAALPVHRKSLNGALLQLGTRAPTKASSCQSCEDCSSHFVKVVCESAGDIWNRLDALNKYIWIRNDWKIVTQKSNTWSCP